MSERNRRRRSVRPLAAAVEACEPRRLFSFVAPAYADKIGLGGVVDYNTSFEDNFDGTAIDKTKWQVRDGYRWRAYRDAPVSTFSYTDETPIQVGNGELQLIAHNDAQTGQLKGAFLQTAAQFDDSSKNSPVPPAKLTPGYTGSFEQTYGYWESRAKFSSLPGEWAAFWVHSYRMVEVRDDPSKTNQPAIFGTEMDVAENQPFRRGVPSLGDVTSIVHANGYGAYAKSTGFYNQTANLNPSKSTPDQYHTYGLLWTQTYVKFFIDGNNVGGTSDPSFVSQVPQMAMLSVEVGAGGSNEDGKGSNSSGYTPAGGYGSKETSQARATFDYVRVWKLVGQQTPTGNSGASGTVFIDANVDAIRQTSEAGRGGVTVYADYDKDGIRDTNEPYVVTDSGGNYTLLNIAPGKAIDLRIVTPAGSKVTTPTSGRQSYVTSPGRVEALRNFAIDVAGTVTPPSNPTPPTPPTTPTPPAPTPPAQGTGTAAGVVWVDADGDRVRDANELGRAGVLIFADLNGNGGRDANEKYATTASDGSYSITGLTAGVSHQIRFAGTNGLPLTTTDWFSYRPTAGGVVSSFNFGIKATTTTPTTPTPPAPTPPAQGTGTAAGVVWVDADGDRVRDANELGRAGVLIFADLNGNGGRDANEKYATTASDGSYSIAGLTAGVSHQIRFAGTNGLPLTTTDWFSYRPTAGGVVSSFNFGIKATTTTPPAPPAPTPPSASTGTAAGVVYLDADRDRVRDANELGRAGLLIFADLNGNGWRDTNEKYTTTASNGSYSITGLTPGVSHQIRFAGVNNLPLTTTDWFSYRPTAGIVISSFNFGIRPA